MYILQPTRQLGAPSPETVKNTVIGVVGAAALVGVLAYFGKSKDRSQLQGARGRRRKGLGDSHAERELDLYIDNDSALYRTKQAMRDAVAKKVCRGKYDAAKAKKGFRAVADVAARAYAKEFGNPRDSREAARTFPGTIRNEVAQGMADELKRDINACLKNGQCGDAPVALLKCPSASPLAGARRTTKKRSR